MNSRLVALTAALSLVASTASAEAYKVNVHVSPMFGTDLQRPGFLSGFDIKIDFALFSFPVAPQIELFGIGSSNNALLINGTLFGAAAGVRWRILNDEKGYRIMPGGTPGNLPGNLWLDAMFAIGQGPRVGFIAGLGYEFSIIDGLQIGPFAKFYWLTDSILMFGLSFSLGGPTKVPDEYDADGDGLVGAADKCPTEEEDKDGVQDDDGCPDPDAEKPKETPPAATPPPDAPPTSPPPAPETPPAPAQPEAPKADAPKADAPK